MKNYGYDCDDHNMADYEVEPMTIKMGYQKAFDLFMAYEFSLACDKATKASYSMSGYTLEICSDGTYKVIWDNYLSNQYNSPGILLGIPPLTEEEVDDDPDLNFYDRAEEAMRDKFEEAMKLLEQSKEHCID